MVFLWRLVEIWRIEVFEGPWVWCHYFITLWWNFWRINIWANYFVSSWWTCILSPWLIALLSSIYYISNSINLILWSSNKVIISFDFIVISVNSIWSSVNIIKLSLNFIVPTLDLICVITDNISPRISKFRTYYGGNDFLSYPQTSCIRGDYFVTALVSIWITSRWWCGSKKRSSKTITIDNVSLSFNLIVITSIYNIANTFNIIQVSNNLILISFNKISIAKNFIYFSRYII